VVIARPANHFTCTRCGVVKNVNPRRRKGDADFVTVDRRNYRCQDCVLVEALIEREEQQ
jgi:hypothetical protein